MRKISSAILNSLMFTTAERLLHLKVLTLWVLTLQALSNNNLMSMKTLQYATFWRNSLKPSCLGIKSTFVEYWMEYIIYSGRSNICMSNSVYRMFSVYCMRYTWSMSSSDNVQQYSLVCGRRSDHTMGSILVQFCAQILERNISVKFVSIKNGLSNFFPFYMFKY